ncbi:hypothetical protein EVAR_76740_1 [Eumeta japonica]|uniref:Uncharacterized protein n=1 Tax=Eumeta variegata TaxID=151549 RepID=A0A4C1STL3_EUMVA|nr:hypothetical protein EVAR_76740_1 [Eumeta japonica]
MRRRRSRVLFGGVRDSRHRIPANNTADPPFLQRDVFSGFQPHTNRTHKRAGVRYAFLPPSFRKTVKKIVKPIKSDPDFYQNYYVPFSKFSTWLYDQYRLRVNI